MLDRIRMIRSLNRRHSMVRPESVRRLCEIGISEADAFQLRRIAMTLHRWHELECGDSDNYKSWSLVRGRQTREVLAGGAVRRGFEYAEDDATDGIPHIETRYHARYKPVYTRIADREAGAKRRLARILKNYPHLSAYVQTDPRGAALYILRPGDVPAGEDVSSYYSRGVAVYK